MVGVPSSRGCMACRQQKKKCVVPSKPPCSRCSRLEISCIGYGDRKFKFLDESQNFVSQRSRNKSTVSLPSSSSQSTPVLQVDQDVEWATTICTRPTNTLSSLISSFTRTISGGDADTGYDLAFNFGVFLHDVPRYLGFNECLDAAAGALVTGYDHFRRYGIKSPASLEALRKYSQAVKSLRNCLSTVEKACTPATLTAIQIIMMIETLIGISNASPLQHAGGAAEVLKCRGTRPPKDDLERNLLMTLRGPVVVKAFFLNESFYTNAEWNSLVEGFSVGVESDGFFPYFAATARLFQRTRRVLSQHPVPQEGPEQLAACASRLHQKITERLSNMLEKLDRAREKWSLETSITESKFAHGLYTREYGLAISAQIQVNCISTALRGQCNECAKKENARLCQEICRLGESDATHHRPLGSAWILIALSVAYLGAGNTQDQQQVVKLILDYTNDFSRQAVEVQPDELEQLATYLSCKDLSSKFVP